MMKKWYFLILAAGLALTPASKALADEIDFGQVTCADFVQMDAETMSFYYFWLDGYASAKSGNTVMDTDTVESDLTQLLEFCSTNPDKTILQAIAE